MSNHERPSENDARRAYVDTTRLDASTEARLHRRLAMPPRTLSWWRLGVPLAVATAVAMAIVVRTPGVNPEVRSLEQWEHEHVSLSPQGVGRVEGTYRAPHVHWNTGTLHAEVAPQQGIDLTVTTDEAKVQVIGTVFDVTRATYATDVSVARGKVEVTCVGESRRVLEAGDRITCLPSDVAMLLLRASAQAEAQAPASERLATLERAAPLAEPGQAAHGELLAHRVRVLNDSGRTEEAVVAAEAYIEAGYAARRRAFLGFVAHRRFEERQCDAQPLLELAYLEIGPGTEAVLLASCLVSNDPGRARDLVDASAPVVDEGWVDHVKALQAVLGGAPR